MDQVKKLKPIDDPDKTVPFLREILGSSRKETEGKATLLCFVSLPFTLATYSVEGKTNKDCFHTKAMMYSEPAIMHTLLDHIAVNVADYASHQIECGAQVLRAHHLGPDDLDIFDKPYADNSIALSRAKHPDVPIIYFANIGSAYLERQKDMHDDMICMNCNVDMAKARKIIGSKDIRVTWIPSCSLAQRCVSVSRSASAWAGLVALDTSSTLVTA